MAGLLHIGTAGWTLPRDHAGRFAADGTHLQRYASRLNCAEVNSSFHRSHMPKTWERWAASTPSDFCFAVKMPKSVTHTAKLRNTGALLLEFFAQIAGLNAIEGAPKLGPVLVQLAPSLQFDEGVAHEFLTTLREVHAGDCVLEPRHATWFDGGADRLLREFDVARVAADPPKGSARAGEPGGARHLRYWRLHGAPRTYYSDYNETFLKAFADRLHADRERWPEADTWVVFDNTALGCAAGNALRLRELMSV